MNNNSNNGFLKLNRNLSANTSEFKELKMPMK